MPGGAKQPDPQLIIVPDALVAGEPGDQPHALHPALAFASSRLSRAAKSWAAVPPLAPIEWYGALIGAPKGASALLAAALGDQLPAEGRQSWLFSPFAGRLGRDSVHIMPADLFAWDAADAEWLAATLTPMLAGDGITLLVRDTCLLAVSRDRWDAKPISFARVAGHVLPNRHPEGGDGGRLMRLCAEMQMLLATQPSERRRSAGLPEVMGVWMWAPSELPALAVDRPAIMAGDALIRACADEVAGRLPAAIIGAAEVEAWLEPQRFPRHWLLAGDGHAVLAQVRAWPRFARRAWQPRHMVAFDALVGQMRRLVGGGDA